MIMAWRPSRMARSLVEGAGSEIGKMVPWKPEGAPNFTWSPEIIANYLKRGTFKASTVCVLQSVTKSLKYGVVHSHR